VEQIGLKQAFDEQIVDNNQPAILRDFEIFLKFVAENDLQASGKMELLPLICNRTSHFDISRD
jgi:hypothetical protein